jgi:hypothetical protein
VKTTTEHIDRVTATLDTESVIVGDPYMLGERFYAEVTRVIAEFDRGSEGDSGLLSLTLEGRRYRRMADGSVRLAPRNREDPVRWKLSGAQRDYVSGDLGQFMSADLGRVVYRMSRFR